jgi:DNA-directed RNA polymerase subunit RPC12/RpoP
LDDQQSENWRNSRNPEREVAAVGGLWACPACREMNSDTRDKCSHCGQRVVWQPEPDITQSDAVELDQWLDGRVQTGENEPENAREMPDGILELARSIRELVCPHCGKTIHHYTHPRPKLQFTAKLLLALNILLIPLCTSLFLIFAPDAIRRMYLFYVVIWVPPTALSWLALSLPRVLSIRCTNCGHLDRQYRPASGFAKFRLAQIFNPYRED